MSSPSLTHKTWPIASAARSPYRAFRRLCPDHGYRHIADNHAVDNWALENGSDYRAAGANASVTSVRADWVLIDDHPVKGRENADSDLPARPSGRR